MKLIPISIILLVLVPLASASIEITSELKAEYHLGDNIDFSVKIIPAESASALLKLTLKCTNSEILYYISPLNLEADVEINVEAPPIKAFSKGLCGIMVNIESLEGGNLEGITSEEFIVSDKLELSFTLDKTEVLPGDKIKIKGSATKNGEEMEDASIIIRFNNEKAQIELNDDEFSYELKLDDDISSGEHTITVEVNDSHENFNEKSVTINVEAIPTTLEFSLNKKEFKPEETLQLTVTLLDQANGLIEEYIEINLLKKNTLFKDEIIFDVQTGANEGFSFTFNYSTPPKDYKLTASFGDLAAEETITILPYPKIEMSIDGDTILIRNVGNVRYNNQTTIVLEKDGKTYLINKKVKLDVGEETTIDLSKEVSGGSYTITLPGETIIKEKIIEKTTERIIEKEVPKYIEKDSDEEEIVPEEEVEIKEGRVIENVQIEDNRPLYKRGLSFITGGVIAGAGVLLSRPKSGSFIMILIILGLIYYFNRKRLSNVIEKIRKKREEY